MQKTLSIMGISCFIAIFSISCRRYSPVKKAEPVKPEEVAIEESTTKQQEVNEDSPQNPEVKKASSFLDNARKALSAATGKGKNDKTAWNCKPDSSPVVLYNVEHNHLVYCHKGNWKAVPARAFPKSPKRSKRKKAQNPNYTERYKENCLNDQCKRSAKLEGTSSSINAPAKKSDFRCRKGTTEGSFVCRSVRIPAH